MAERKRKFEKPHLEPCGTGFDGEPAWIYYLPNGELWPLQGSVRSVSDFVNKHPGWLLGGRGRAA